MKGVAIQILAAVCLVTIGSNISVSQQKRTPNISYIIHVDQSDLSGFNVEMKLRGVKAPVRLAMASHPEYDDRYWRYIENLSAKSQNVELRVDKEESEVWRIYNRTSNVDVTYRVHLPPQTSAIRDSWKPFLSATCGLVGDLHSLMYVIGATTVPARITLDIPRGWAVASALQPLNDPLARHLRPGIITPDGT